MPRGIRKELHTPEEQVGQEEVVTMSATGAPKFERADIQPVDGPGWKDKAEILKFMDEVVTVRVHESNDRFEPQFVELFNYGRRQIIPRGIDTPVKRKYIEILARLKQDNFANEEYMDPSGARNVRWPKTTGLRFPFSVVEDQNPKGRDWLRKILAEAA